MGPCRQHLCEDIYAYVHGEKANTMSTCIELSSGKMMRMAACGQRLSLLKTYVLWGMRIELQLLCFSQHKTH
jgi:hypothetical protein